MEKLYGLYFKMPKPGFLNKGNKAIDRVLGFAVKRIMDSTVVSKLKESAGTAPFGLNKEKRDEEYIVSLTSFPGRIEEVWITVDTLLRQSFKPDRVILYLSKVQFPEQKIPQTLEDLKPRGLEVVFVEDDLRSHKKYFYAFKSFPNSNVITVDDDVYYPKDTLKYLAEAHKQHPNSVVANRAHIMTFQDSKLKPYRQWKHNAKNVKKPTFMLVPTGVGGVLYPAGCYHPDIFDEATFRDICFMADDLWLKIATVRNNAKVVTTPYFTRDLITTGETQKIKLVADNSHGGGNDKQFKDILDFYNMNIADYRDID